MNFACMVQLLVRYLIWHAQKLLSIVLSSNIDEPLYSATNVSKHSETQHVCYADHFNFLLTHKNVNARDIHYKIPNIEAQTQVHITPQAYWPYSGMKNFLGPMTANKLYGPLTSNLKYCVLQNGSTPDHILIINHPE